MSGESSSPQQPCLLVQRYPDGHPPNPVPDLSRGAERRAVGRDGCPLKMRNLAEQGFRSGSVTGDVMNGIPSDHEPIRVGRPALYMPESIDTCHPKYKRCLTWPGTKAKSAQLGCTRGPGGAPVFAVFQDATISENLSLAPCRAPRP